FFSMSPPQRVFVLQCGERLDCVCATNRLHSRFRKAEVLYLALANQILHRSGHVFDWNVRINAMLVEQINHIRPESLQRSFSNLFDVLWPTIQADLFTFRTKFETEFGCYHHLTTERSKRFADELFIRERSVNFSGIEERDAAFDRHPNQ